jgi:hypothetical protein
LRDREILKWKLKQQKYRIILTQNIMRYTMK